MNRYTYKAKRKDNGEWVCGFLTFDNHNAYICTSLYGDKWEVCDLKTICQCTGLQDIEGNYIFEYDMLDGLYEKLYIGYCEECKQFQLKDIFENDCFACLGDIHLYEFVEDCNKFKIIGNKFDEVQE